MSEKDPLADLQEVPSNWVKWGKPGDYIRGTLVSRRVQDGYNPGKKKTVYEIKAQIGQFHPFDEKSNPVSEPIKINEGEFWQVGSQDWQKDEMESSINKQMRNVKLGQIVAVQFKQEVPSQKFKGKMAKVIKVLVGNMDETWMGEDSSTVETISADDAPPFE